MSKSQVSVDISLLFTALVIIAVYAFTTFFFISNTDNVRIGMAREEWRNEAVFIANQLVLSPNCLGYIKNFIKYDNSSTGELMIFKLGVPNAVDANKLSIDRLRSCLRMLSPEYTVYFELRVVDDTGIVFEGANIDKNLYFTQSTYEEVVIPVRVIYDDRVSYGNAFVGVSVSLEYFKTRVV